MSFSVERGCWYAFRDRAHALQIDLDNGFQIIDVPKSGSKETARVMQNGQEIYSTEIRTFGYSGLLEAWGYQNHWVIEVVTQADGNALGNGKSQEEVIRQLGIDVIRDGQSLSQLGGYEKVFGFQLLANKPFYFYKKHNGTFGISFDGLATDLDYDDILYTNPHPGLDASIIHCQNMVLFGATKGHVQFMVAIGAFNP